MVLVQPLHLFEQRGLLSHLGKVVDGLVKDRNIIELFAVGVRAGTDGFASLLLLEDRGCLLHDRVGDLGEVLAETFTGRGSCGVKGGV